MLSAFLPVAFAMFAWWFATGAVLYLDGLPPRTFRWTMLGATILAFAGLAGLAMSGSDASPSGAYVSFTCGLLVWAWQEVSFYTGYVTGPRKHACGPRCRGVAHFGHAVQASLYHEVAIIASAALIFAVSWSADNKVGAWTFLLLWVMHESARLNVFLGARNLSADFLPDHLRYLRSFLRHRPMNLLFPISITASVVAATLLVQAAFAAETGSFRAVQHALLAALLILAIAEHWFLMLPLPIDALWRWALRSRAGASKAARGLFGNHHQKTRPPSRESAMGDGYVL